jgi:molecular chaperone DnaK (HSP70)
VDSPKYAFSLPYFYETVDLDDELTVPQYEAVIAPAVASAVEVAESAICKAGIGKDDLSGILLAGGSSQIPLVRDVLAERFACKTRIAAKDLMWLIAKGAAIHHRDLMTRPREATRLILGADLYLETFSDGRLTPTLLVPSHQTLPHQFTREFPISRHTSSLTIQLLTETGTRKQRQSRLNRRVISVASLGLTKITVKVTIDRNKTIKLAVINPKTNLLLDNVEIRGDVLSTPDEILAARSQYGLTNVVHRPATGNQRHCIGIDLGTTTCEVVVWNQEQRTFERGIPDPQLSQVLVRDSGLISVDDGEYNPSMEGYFSNFKVDIGREFDIDRYTAHGKVWPPDILSAHLLATIWRRVQERFGASDPIAEAVVTVPSDFSEDQSARVLNAARMAGIDVPILLPEPIAAFLTYADTYPAVSEAGQLFLIFDFGGGTTDVCVIETRSDGSVGILATYGNNAVGGKDLTYLIASRIVQRFIEANELEICEKERERLCRTLFSKADKAKVALSMALMTGEAVGNG